MNRTALVIGESLVDIVSKSDGSSVEHPGGSPANVAVALARLGADVGLATAYADDRLGGLLDQHFADAGVSLAGDPHVLARTSSAVATLDDTGAASYVFDLEWDLPPLPTADPPALVHTGSARCGDGARSGESRRHHRGARTDLDSQLRHQRPPGRDRSRRSDRGAGRGIWWPSATWSRRPTRTSRCFIPAPKSRSASSACSGSVPVQSWSPGAARARPATPRAGSVEVAAEPVEVADTIGAGDSFCAALLDGLRRRDLLGAVRRPDLQALPLDAWREVVTRANRAAAITVSRPGANPPTAAELEAADWPPALP